jgi:type IV pilus assembly protein PilA
MRSTGRRRALVARGFTLVELLAVVAMIGVLAALAVVGYRKQMNSAAAAEAAAVIQGIRGAEEAYRAEMLVYLGCSGCGAPAGCPPGAGSLSSYYPTATSGNARYHWIQPGHPDFACFRLLNVTTDGPVRFGYAVVAGLPHTITAAPTGFASPPVWPSTVAQPWFVIQARGDRDEDGVPALFLASSLRGEIYSENDSE